tara:strand:+ start:1249 stop:1719 length:471 start_codon:yes stop_codon:yes gene_type:complete
MQNYIKNKTRLAFIQYVFSSLFNIDDNVNEENIKEFEKYFHKLNVSSIDERKELVLNFNKSYFKKLALNYQTFIKKNNISKLINPLIKFNRNYENWDKINKSIILSIFSELEITSKDKVKILLNDYLNISKSFIPVKEMSMLNAIIDKYINERKII